MMTGLYGINHSGTGSTARKRDVWRLPADPEGLPGQKALSRTPSKQYARVAYHSFRQRGERN
jgi:hypothetical protein